MAAFSGYSLWLLPDEPSIKQLSATIEEYAEKLDTPVFGPHMTLLGGVPVRCALWDRFAIRHAD